MPIHKETRNLPYTVDQIYNLVADVAKYPDFLPWCAAARITASTKSETQEIIEADLMISFKVFREKFGSRVTRTPPPKTIDTEYLDGPFKYMKSNWTFEDRGSSCDVTFFVDFEFKNAILQGIIGLVFNEAMQRVVRAFEQRAKVLYSG